MRSKTDRRAWELSGVAGEDGSLERPLPAGMLFVPPPPNIEGNELVWRSELDQAIPLRAAHPDRGLLLDFVRLSEAPNQTILAFAEKWGILWPGSDTEPLPSDSVLSPKSPPSEGISFMLVGGWNDGAYREPLATWRQHSGTARATLNVAAALHASEPGRIEDWHALYPAFADDARVWGHVEGFPNREEATRVAWIRLKDRVMSWLEAGDVRPRLSVGVPGKPQVVLGGRGLFGALGVQLLFAVSAAQGLAICSGCGETYARKRRASITRRNYCDACRNSGAPLRDARRDSDRRKREAIHHAGDQPAPNLKPQGKTRGRKKTHGRPSADKRGRTAKTARSRK